MNIRPPNKLIPSHSDHFSSWNLTLQLRYTEDGHVVTIASQEGHTITLDVVETGSVRLTLQAPDGRQVSAKSGQVLSRNFFFFIDVVRM